MTIRLYGLGVYAAASVSESGDMTTGIRKYSGNPNSFAAFSNKPSAFLASLYAALLHFLGKMISKYAVFKTDTLRAVLNTFACAAAHSKNAAAAKNPFLRFTSAL